MDNPSAYAFGCAVTIATLLDSLLIFIMVLDPTPRISERPSL